MKKQKPYVLKRTKLSTYQGKFSSIKTEFLKFKFILDNNVEAKGSKQIKTKLEVIAKLLFEIEKEFNKNIDLEK